jgi:prephenate dehydratase
MNPRRTVTFLGPLFTFSHEAAQRLYPDYEMVPADTFQDVFNSVSEGSADYGVLPVENSSAGAIAETFQLLLDQDYVEGEDGLVSIEIVDELFLPIWHNLLATQPVSLGEIKNLYTHYQPRLQCIQFIESELRSTEIILTGSTSDAGRLAAEDSEGACIGSRFLGDSLGLSYIREGIQDVKRNVTRFVSISAAHRSNERSKTNVAFVIPDKRGKLIAALQCIADSTLNVSSIKTLPVRDPKVLRANFKDWFVIEVNAGDTDARYKGLLAKVRENTDIFLGYKKLGSYGQLASDELPVHDDALALTPAMSSSDEYQALISLGESGQIEFKSTFRLDLKTNRPNKELVKAVVKTVAAFMNTQGGLLFIGVNDDGDIVGIDKEIENQSKSNPDAFGLSLFQSVTDSIGAEYCHYIDLEFVEMPEKSICVARVEPSSEPAWIKDGETEHFYIRAGNSSRPLNSRTAHDYITRRFR